MARVTTEDCLKNNGIESHFDLVLLASHRARLIDAGEPSMLDANSRSISGILPFRGAFSYEKSTVTALREIAKNLVDVEKIKNEIRSASLDSVKKVVSSSSKDMSIEDLESLIEDREEMIAEDVFYISSEDESYEEGQEEPRDA